jgi:hypothetical protein
MALPRDSNSNSDRLGCHGHARIRQPLVHSTGHGPGSDLSLVADPEREKGHGSGRAPRMTATVGAGFVLMGGAMILLALTGTEI